jgi:hypothetical protein
MNDKLESLTVEQKLQLLEQLLPLVSRTCGRNNCNCPGSGPIKKLIDQSGLAPSVDKNNR